MYVVNMMVYEVLYISMNYRNKLKKGIKVYVMYVLLLGMLDNCVWIYV